MRYETEKVLVSDGHGNVQRGDSTVAKFESLNEALDTIGEMEALRLLNYAYTLVQRNNARNRLLKR